MREAYDNRNTKTLAAKVIITFLTVILTLNNFVFNSIIYLQRMGYAMGTICAVACAKNFLAQFEKQHIYPDIKNKSILYLGYIDDIFMIWTWAKQELLIFLEKLNSKHKTLEFEHNISHGNVSFFDALIKNRFEQHSSDNSTENPLIRNRISMHIQTIQSPREYLITKCWGSKSSVSH